MLSSNQPYQRVDEGVGSGLIAGGLIGGAAAGAAHKWGSQGLQSMGQNAMDRRAFANTMVDGMKDVGNSKTFDKYAKQIDSADQKLNAYKKLDKMHTKGFAGGWKGKAAAYGGSVLAGGLIGAGIDSAN